MNPLVVVALDCADYDLVRRWGCDNMLLDEHAALQSIASNRDVPVTEEVWPAVATGKHPNKLEPIELQWANPLLAAVARLASRVHPGAESALRDWVYPDADGHEFSQLRDSHLFEAGRCKGWPGLTPARNLAQTRIQYGRVHGGKMSVADHNDAVAPLFGEELLWTLAQLDAGVPVVGVHMHLLDTMGHVYAERPEQLQKWYRIADSALGVLRDRADRLVILSDHGIQTTACGDADPGDHSWRAMVAAQGVDGGLPDSVLDVREWLTPQIRRRESVRPPAEETGDTTREQLAALGYLDGGGR